MNAENEIEVLLVEDNPYDAELAGGRGLELLSVTAQASTAPSLSISQVERLGLHGQRRSTQNLQCPPNALTLEWES